MGFFLGIDSGGSKTECVLADEAGAVLARATGPGANVRRVSPAELRAALNHCLQELCRHTGLSSFLPEVVCGGFAGAGDSQARETARNVLAELLRPRHLYVVGDMEIALEAAVGAGSGVVLVAGTGSIAYGRNDRGQQARAGGEGPQLLPGGEVTGDVGSGFYIGQHALEVVRRAHKEHRSATPLAEMVLAALSAKSLDDLETRLSQGSAAVEVAALVPQVVAAARAGDREARDILAEASAALAGLVVTVLRELGLLEAEVPVATSGGVFAESAEVFAGVRAKIQAVAPRARVEPLRVPPAEGALRLAQRLWLQERAAPPA